MSVSGPVFTASTKLTRKEVRKIGPLRAYYSTRIELPGLLVAGASRESASRSLSLRNMSPIFVKKGKLSYRPKTVVVFACVSRENSHTCSRALSGAPTHRGNRERERELNALTQADALRVREGPGAAR